ncbi:LAT2 domain-containing protein isoform X1 [Conger conger]|nr:LAT2 domain-containing protein isoform X1 [Conger conger]
MPELFSQQEAGLALASLVSLGVLFAMCLSCRRRTRIIREENIIYGPELVRGGQRFNVVRSTTVRLNEKPKDQPFTPRGPSEVVCAEPAAAEDQSSYQNVPKSDLGDFDSMYVNPIPNLVYQNVTSADKNKDDDTNSYENVFPTLKNAIGEDSDSSDYANADFLQEMKEEEEEPDYVNTEDQNKT